MGLRPTRLTRQGLIFQAQAEVEALPFECGKAMLFIMLPFLFKNFSQKFYIHLVETYILYCQDVRG
jgi:hypothetical protein